MKFSEVTHAILHDAGWSEDYRHDTTPDAKLLKQAGYPVFPVVIEFLSRFGGIRFNYPHPIMSGYEEYALFKVAEGSAYFLLEHVALDAEYLGRPLCLIGECYSGNMWMMMDEEGCVYTDYGSEMFFIGTSGEDAIEALCTRRSHLDITQRLVSKTASDES
jgi:hypothetical protein